jgi:hypothetical protein
MVSAFLLAAVQLTARESEAMARDLLGPEHVSNRLDCRSRRPHVSGSPDAEVNRVFLFPLRPHLKSAEGRARLSYLTTLNDGRTFLREGRIASIVWEQWPRFSARLVLAYGTIALESDAAVPGRVTLLGDFVVSHGPNYEVRGDCRFVPEVPTNEAPAR